MKGILQKTESGIWMVKWSDLHSFSQGTIWSFTPLHQDDITDDLQEGQIVDVVFVHNDFDFTTTARISKFDPNQVHASSKTDLKKKLLDLHIEYRHSLKKADLIKVKEIDKQIDDIEKELEIRERLSR